MSSYNSDIPTFVSANDRHNTHPDPSHDTEFYRSFCYYRGERVDNIYPRDQFRCEDCGSRRILTRECVLCECDGEFYDEDNHSYTINGEDINRNFGDNHANRDYFIDDDEPVPDLDLN